MICSDPYYLDLDRPKMDKEGNAIYSLPVQCGKCPYCKERKSKQWGWRLVEEQKQSESSFFVTLTYKPKYVPLSDNGFMTLRKSDLQDFLKRLKIRHDRLDDREYEVRRMQRKPIRYYAVGEYGGITKRPHYHLILFNAIEDEIQKAWSTYHRAKGQKKGLYEELGNAFVKGCGEASISYTLKYLRKESDIKFFEKYDVEPLFTIMSRNIGKCYLNKDFIVNWHRKNPERVFGVTEKGFKVPLPRTFIDEIWKFPDEREIVARTMREKANEIDTDDRDYFRRLLRPYSYEHWRKMRSTAKYTKLNRFSGGQL